MKTFNSLLRKRRYTHFSALVICNLVIFFTALMTIYCSFDVAGRSWVKLKKYQKSLRDQNSGGSSNNSHRNGDGEMQVVKMEPGHHNVAATPGKRMAYKRSGGNPNRSWRHR